MENHCRKHSPSVGLGLGVVLVGPSIDPVLCLDHPIT